MHNQLTQSSDAGDNWSKVEIEKYRLKSARGGVE